MFTGLVETTGSLTALTQTGSGIRLSLKPLSDFAVEMGDSVSVNGVCLTVTGHNDEISFDVSPETIGKTNLRELKAGDRVNLERALRLSDRLGGHIVTGHIDNTGKIKGRRPEGEYTFFTIESASDILKYVVRKGSIAIDGISLTVNDLDSSSFSVAIIPHTLQETNIGDKNIGATVNLEVDIIGKYVEKLLGKRDSDGRLMNLLKEEGFIDD